MTNARQSAPRPSTPKTPTTPLTPRDDTQWGSLAHVGGILGILPSLIIWLVFKERGTFTRIEGKEALNFQITAGIAALIGFALMPVLIGFVIVPAVLAASAVFSLFGYLQARDGIGYRYPFALRLIK